MLGDVTYGKSEHLKYTAVEA